MNLICILGFDKNRGIGCVQIEIKMNKNKKENFLKHWATGLGF